MLGAFQSPQSLELFEFEAADAGRLLEDNPPVAGRFLQQHVDFALLDHAVRLGPHAGAGEQIADVAQPGREAIDEILALAAPIDAAGDVDLGGVDRQQLAGVVEGERDFSRVQSPPGRRAVEDDVGHLLAAEALDALLAEHPLDRVDDVRLARSVGPHHDRDPGGEFESGPLGKALETDEFEGVEHGEAGFGDGMSTGWNPAGFSWAVVTKAQSESRPIILAKKLLSGCGCLSDFG